MIPKYQYRAKIVRWVDGDTVDVDVDLGFRITTHQRLRLLGVDTPERGQDGYHEATEFCKTVAPEGAEVVIRTEKSDSFGRYLAHIEVFGRSVADGLLIKGLAKVYE